RNDEIAQIVMDTLATPAVGQSAARPAAVFPPQSVRETADQPPTLPAQAPGSTWGEAPPPSEDEELLDLDDFRVGGVPLSSLGAPPPLIEPLAPPPNAASATLREDGDESKADPVAVAATSDAVSAVEPPIDLATDVNLGLRDDGQSTTTFSEERVKDT